MADKVLAAVAVEAQRTELQEFDVPALTSDSGLMQVEATGVCGTDWSYYESEIRNPLILGHHTVGYISAVGINASDRWGISEGDRALIEEYVPCRRCAWCNRGEFRMCRETDPRSGGLRYGASPVAIEPSLWGGFSEYQYLHPNALVHRLDNHVPAEEAALALPLSNGIEWVQLEGCAEENSRVVVQGPGQLGLACVIAAKAAGASEIILSGLTKDTERLELAKSLGATHVVDVERDDLVSLVEDVTDGEMADLVIDAASGNSSTVTSAIDVAGKEGIVLLAGFKNSTVTDFPSDQLLSKRLTLKGVRGHRYESVETAIDLISSGEHDLGSLCTHQFSLCDTDRALRTLGGVGDPGAVCVTVVP